MIRTFIDRQRARTVSLIAAVLIAGCAEERDAVDRVQPYALDKAYFIGADFTDTRDDPEFYARNHVIDVGYGADGAASSALFTSTFAEPVARIKWQITEDYLIGRLSYERIEGSDGKGVPGADITGTPLGSKENDGIVVALFAVESHFDIVNDYNPTTGEQLNVVVENDKDRPWYERQYMRVDWSKNLNTDSYDFDTLSMMGVYGGVEYEPVSFYVEDPNSDQAPHFELEEGYFDVTTKVFAKPLDIDLSELGWGMKTIPACYLPYDFLGGSYPAGSCNPVEVTLRHSFVRIDKDGDGKDDSDYEPRDYDGKRFEAYGGFYTERFGYARNYGMTDAQWHRMLNRYNIWERSHYYDDPKTMTGEIPCDDNADNNDNGTADACEAVSERSGKTGSQCDLFKGMCTLPYRARIPKPIAIYYTDTSNPDYYEPSETAVHQWDVALRSAVQTAKYTECMRTVRTSADLPSDWDAWAAENPDADMSDIADMKEAYLKARKGGDDICRRQYPVWTGQMDDQEDAVALAQEVDDCRNGVAYKGKDCSDELTRIADLRGIAPNGITRPNGVRAAAAMDEMLVLCHSPVRWGDPASCGDKRLPEGVDADICTAAKNIPEGGETPVEVQDILDAGDDIASVEQLTEACDAALRVRHGDLRYHVLNVVDTPQDPSPWGIMVSSIDPVTGENIATNCNIWSHVTDLASQKIVDQMRLIKGELSFEDVTEATDVADWVSAAQAAAQDGALGTVSRAQLSERISNFLTHKADPKFLDELKAGMLTGADLSEADPKTASSVFAQLRNYRADATVSNSAAAVVESRRSAAETTQFEASLMTEAILEKADATDLALTDSVLDAASPLRGGSPTLSRNVRRMMENAFHERNICMLDASMAQQTPVALAPLADRLERKFGKFNADDPIDVQLDRAEKIRRYLAQKIHFGVFSHEIGHSISHRHNFVGSSDAWSYRPQYWQLRTMDGTVTAECSGTEASGENCVGPRYIDPVTDAERDNLIYMFMTSSVMDYPGDITQDFMAPGIYDFAATRMFYGDVVSVIDEDSFYEPSAGESPSTLTMLRDKPFGAAFKRDTGFGGLLGIQYSDADGTIHYSQAQQVFGLITPASCKEVPVPDVFRAARYDKEVSGEWDPVLDGTIVAPDGRHYTRCRQPSVDYITWGELRTPPYPLSAYVRNADASRWRDNPYWDDRDRVVEPYSYASDSWADIGNVSVYRHDNGADLYEIFNFLITEKEMSYIFDKYRRGRSDFSIKSAADRGLFRYDEKVKEGAKALAFYKNFIDQYAVSIGVNPEPFFPQVMLYNWDNHIQSNIIASTYAFDFFARELARPSAGGHGYAVLDEDDVLRSAEDISMYYVEAADVDVSIPNGPSAYWNMMSPGGQLLENQLASDQGEFDRDYTLNCGSYYDKANVAMLLTESVDNFISSSRTDFYDPRFRSASLADLFPDGYRRLIGNALTNDEFIKGPRIATSASGTPVVDDEGFPVQGIGWPSWWGETPTHCFPIAGRNVCGDFATGDFENDMPAYIAPVDSQIGWEQQKFLIAWTLLYLPENQKRGWLNQLQIYQLGADADPAFENRIELHHPDAPVFVARTFGREEIFGRTVQKGIAARVIEYADSLLAEAYESTEVDVDNDGIIDWHEPVFQSGGQPAILYDARIDNPDDPETCNDTDNSGCTCSDNRACMLLQDYLSVPAYLRQALTAYDMADASLSGVSE